MVGTGPLSVEDVVKLTRGMRASGVAAFKALGVEVEFSSLAQVDAAKAPAKDEEAGGEPDDVVDDALLFHSTEDVEKVKARK